MLFMSFREQTSALGNEPLQFLEPVLDDDDLRRGGLIGGLLDHEETLAVGGHVIVPGAKGSPVTYGPSRTFAGVPALHVRPRGSTRTAMSAPSGAT